MTTPLKHIITKGKRLQPMQAVFHYYAEFLEENIKFLYNVDSISSSQLKNHCEASETPVVLCALRNPSIQVY